MYNCTKIYRNLQKNLPSMLTEKQIEDSIAFSLMVLGFFTGDILNILLYPIAFWAYVWIYFSIQRSVKYLACVQKQINKLFKISLKFIGFN